VYQVLTQLNSNTALVFFITYYQDDQFVDMMGGACSMHGDIKISGGAKKIKFIKKQ
jgi:hypothetical protein